METGSGNSDEFKTSELEELTQLTIQHRRGQITDLDFEEQAAWILRGRGFPILTSLPELPEPETSNSASLIKKQNEISALTSCGERSKRARQSYFRKQKDMRQESLVKKVLDEEEKLKLKKKRDPLADSLILEERVLTSSVSNHITSINKSVDQEPVRKNIKPILIASGLTLLLITILIILISGRQKSREIVSVDELNTLLTAHNENPDIPLLFGPAAVSQCNTLCQSKNTPNCESMCRKLSFEMYPRRISLSDNAPEAIANRLNQSCIKAFKASTKTGSGDAAINATNYPQLENLAFADLVKEYSVVSSEHANSQHSVSLCLRANEIISYIGAIVANSYRDNYSVAYYQLTQRALANKNAEIQAKLPNSNAK